MLHASDSAKLAFAETLLTRLSTEPITAISKSEPELLVFRGLLAAGIISLDQSHFEMATTTMLPKAKIENLRYRHRLTRQNPEEEFAELSRHIYLVDVDPVEEELIISIEDKFFREMFESRLRRLNVHFDGSFKKDLLHVSLDNFEQVIGSISPEAAKSFVSAKTEAMKNYRKETAREAIKAFILNVTRESLVATLSSFINPH